MILNDGAFFFDHQNLFETLGKVMGQPRFQRPGHADFENPDADFCANDLGNPHVLKRLYDVEVSLTRRDDAKAGVGAIQYDTIEAIDPGELAGRIDFVFVEAELLLQRERRAAEQLKEAEALADATLAFDEADDDDDDDLFGMEEAVARRYPELEARASEVATSEALLALFPEASLTMTAAVADELKDACFGLDGFYCSAVDSCAAGAIFRGNVRTKTAKEALEVCVGRLGKKPALADDWKLFVMEDPVPPTDEEIDDRIREAQAKAQAGEATLLRDDEPDNELMLACLLYTSPSPRD